MVQNKRHVKHKRLTWTRLVMVRRQRIWWWKRWSRSWKHTKAKKTEVKVKRNQEDQSWTRPRWWFLETNSTSGDQRRKKNKEGVETGRSDDQSQETNPKMRKTCLPKRKEARWTRRSSPKREQELVAHAASGAVRKAHENRGGWRRKHVKRWQRNSHKKQLLEIPLNREMRITREEQERGIKSLNGVGDLIKDSRGA